MVALHGAARHSTAQHGAAWRSTAPAINGAGD